MDVLIACEFSGIVRDAFINEGHNAMSCDLLFTEKPGPPHFTGNVLDIINDGWDLMVAHPPCTYLANSGVKHLHTDPSRWKKLDVAARFFKKLLNAKIPRICIENPVMHRYGKERIGRVRQSQLVQPWMFGHMEKKATCLWLKGLPLLKETDNVKSEMEKLPDNIQQKCFYMRPSIDRWKLRSTTYQGLADAMANQWSNR